MDNEREMTNLQFIAQCFTTVGVALVFLAVNMLQIRFTGCEGLLTTAGRRVSISPAPLHQQDYPQIIPRTDAEICICSVLSQYQEYPLTCQPSNTALPTVL